ncbi:MAG: hypothetical protein YYHSYBAR_002416 [Candidatus Fervidibacter sacchari]
MNQVTSGSMRVGDYESGSAKGQRQKNVHQQTVSRRESFRETLPVDIVDGRDQRARSCQGSNVLDMEQVNSVSSTGSREQNARVEPAGKFWQANNPKVGRKTLPCPLPLIPRPQRKWFKSVSEQQKLVGQIHCGKLPQQVQQISSVASVRSEQDTSVNPYAHGICKFNLAASQK